MRLPGAIRYETGPATPLPRDREIVVCSETPFRTSAAASYLRIQGFPKVRSLAGGLALWARRPLEERRTLRQA